MVEAHGFEGDGHFSGPASGPCVGFACPEAWDDAPSACVRNGDLIEIDVPDGRLRLLILEGRGITETREGKIEIGSGSVQTKNVLI